MAHNAIYINGIHHGVVKKGRNLTSIVFRQRSGGHFSKFKSCGKIAKMRSVSVLFLLVALTYAQEPRRCGKTKLNPS